MEWMDRTLNGKTVRDRKFFPRRRTINFVNLDIFPRNNDQNFDPLCVGTVGDFQNLNDFLISEASSIHVDEMLDFGIKDMQARAFLAEVNMLVCIALANYIYPEALWKLNVNRTNKPRCLVNLRAQYEAEKSKSRSLRQSLTIDLSTDID